MGEISEFTTRPELSGTFGMVASTHWLASAAGLAVLEHGGNAFDAAVAAGLVLQVVEPHLNGLGGEVPVIAHHAGRGETFVLCGQGTAPAAATPEAFGDLGLDLVPGSGLLAACVPGAFGAWMMLLREYGTLRLRDVLGYAIGYAAGGYPLIPAISWGIASVAELFRDHWPSSAAVYLPGGQVPAPGSLFANPALAATYQRILDEAEAAGTDRDEQIEAARRVYYEGFVAETIDAYLSSAEVMDVTGEPHRGLLAYDDLASWHPRLEEPLTYDVGGLTVCKTKPWGQGPVFLQQLALLDGFDLAAMEPGSADFIHTVTECGKLAFADREAWYGDPDFTDVPVKALLSAQYADARRQLVGPRASGDLVPGSPDGRTPRLPAFATAAAPRLDAGTGEPTMSTSGPAGPAASSYRAGDTCHLDVVDRFGNMVSATPSGGWLQSSPVIGGLGFCLGTRAQMFTLTPGLPATIAPGKRPRTTLTPSLALRDREPYLAFGTPGGDQQDQWSLQVFLNHLHFGMNLQQAIDFPAFHSAHMPSSFYPRAAQPRVLDVESRVSPAVVEELRRRGHLVNVRPAWSLGRVSAVARRNGVLYAAANPRGMQGYAVGRLPARPLPAPKPHQHQVLRASHDACHGGFLRDGTTGPGELAGGIGIPGARSGDTSPAKPRQRNDMTPQGTDYGISQADYHSAASPGARHAAPVVTFENVSKHFGKLRAVDGLNLELRHGETVALLGPNGAGKSTSLDMLLALRKPTGGTIRMFGSDPYHAVKSGRVGAMLQSGGLMPEVTVRELVTLVTKLHPKPELVETTLKRAGIAEFAEQRVDRLSGGQTQRVRFALAICGQSELIVLDEPTTAMDVETRRMFWASMKEEVAEGRTLLFATHYLEEADQAADRILVINRGRLLADGTPTEIKTRAGARRISFRLDRVDESFLLGLPGLVNLEVRHDVVQIQSADSDATLYAVLDAGLRPREIEVTSLGLEQAFIAITSEDDRTHGNAQAREMI